MNRVNGKVGLVTGAERGIDYAFSKLLSDASAKVVVADIDLGCARKILDAIRKLGGAAIAVQQDVSSESD